MPKIQKLLVDEGSTAINFFIHTPICCPSRSELLSGRYFHNIKTTHAPACMHVDETKVNNNTFAKYLAQGGYRVGMFGKYLNILPSYIPPGFEVWMANGGGTYISPEFNTFNVPGLANGKVQFDNAPGNYSTSVIGNHSISFIRKSVAAKTPFMAYIGPKAAHEPFNPAPWYAGYWDASWPEHEPRPVAWNCSAESRADHHGNIATEQMISEAESAVITGVFKNRWRTLMSVDDLIGDVVTACKELGVDDNTYSPLPPLPCPLTPPSLLLLLRPLPCPALPFYTPLYPPFYTPLPPLALVRLDPGCGPGCCTRQSVETWPNVLQTENLYSSTEC